MTGLRVNEDVALSTKRMSDSVQTGSDKRSKKERVVQGTSQGAALVFNPPATTTPSEVSLDMRTIFFPLTHCEHNRRWSRCKDCGGSAFCQHQRRRIHCKDCGGSGLCEHQRVKHLQRLRRQQPLSAPAAEEPVQRLRRQRLLPAPTSKEPLQRLPCPSPGQGQEGKKGTSTERGDGIGEGGGKGSHAQTWGSRRPVAIENGGQGRRGSASTSG